MIQEYLQKIRKTVNEPYLKAALYARYSSDMQRSESIDAQIRFIKEFAECNGIIIVQEYIDEAKSAMRDDRENFQQMISDAKSNLCEWHILLVHKLDRFARNRYDSANYRVQLRKNKKYIISVTEQLDDSPESLILEAVIEAMAEYYSKNLSREVMKGLRENALKCKSCGGLGPLGYDIDPVTKKFFVNEFEAQAVQLIFNRFLEGKGYGSIIQELNDAGYRTKHHKKFGKNSLYEILKNEKYTGVYIYNRTQKADELTGKRNSHAYKTEDEVIRIQDAFPAIITKEQFKKVQEIFLSRKRKYTNNAKEEYLLTGKIFCGVCGAAYVGTRRFNNNGKKYVYYVCNINERSARVRCNNGCISRDILENYVLETINDYILYMEERYADNIYNQYVQDCNKNIVEQKRLVYNELNNIKKY